ncbi:MAG: D-alanyl-D-alanine carboxypeptidase [Lachnospiraceae bacterium]|nr:D-alanyl-D-alanine carboxypeptidase [Lachnospiraceae bacterium]
MKPGITNMINAFRKIHIFITILVLAVLLSVTIYLPVSADEVETISESICVIEEQTGTIVISKNQAMQCYPASTTKLLTALIVLEKADLNDTLLFSERAVSVPEGYTTLPAYAGEEMTVLDCLYGMMVMSANDCANAIAEYVGGSIDAFVEMMNEKAAELGCLDSHFTSPFGQSDPDHYSTAYDMCLIGRAAFENDLIVKLCSTPEYTIPTTNLSDERHISSKNKLFDPTSEYYNPSVLASKSGYLDTGRCIVTKAEVGGKSYIISCMHSPEYYGVFDDTNVIVDYILKNPATIPAETEEEHITDQTDKEGLHNETPIKEETIETTSSYKPDKPDSVKDGTRVYLIVIPCLVCLAIVIAIVVISKNKHRKK